MVISTFTSSTLMRCNSVKRAFPHQFGISSPKEGSILFFFFFFGSILFLPLIASFQERSWYCGHLQNCLLDLFLLFVLRSILDL